METVKKKDLSDIIEKQRVKLTKYEDQLRDIVPAYESLITEKQVLEESLKAFTTKKRVSDSSNDQAKSSVSMNSAVNKKQDDIETVEQLKSQLDAIMNSLATLSAEKSRMEANFQNDKRQLRGERDECEKVIKDLREKLKQVQKQMRSDIENVKYKLIMERHEREKEQTDHSAMMKELQRLLNDERRAKDQLENQLKESKNQDIVKDQSKILETALEITKNKLKQVEAAANETPSILLSLKNELASLKLHHRNAIQEEKQRAASAEQKAAILAETHEARVASLEARLAELSDTVGGYDRMRHKDQQAILKLKEQLARLQNEKKERADNQLDNNSDEIAAKIKKLYNHLLDLANREGESSDAKDALAKLGLRYFNEDLDYKEKYETLEREFQNLNSQLSTQLRASVKKNEPQKKFAELEQNSELTETKNNKIELNISKCREKNLEERLRTLNAEMSKREKEFKAKLERQQQLVKEERIKSERALTMKDNDYRSKISALEHQVLRQRERSIALIREKDDEIQTLKASFHALLPKKNSSQPQETYSDSPPRESNPETPSDLVTGLLTVESPPMLHYAQELARREVQVSGLRKANVKLESELREQRREFLHANERQKEEHRKLQSLVTRLEACKSREGANLEYLKNVILNYLVTSDVSSKRHMLNAISTVLHFTPEEMEKLRHLK